MAAKLAGAPYTRDSVENALSLHVKNGSIQHWQRNPVNTGHTVRISSGDYLVTQNLRETAILTHGIGSAINAIQVPAGIEKKADEFATQYVAQTWHLAQTAGYGLRAFKAGFLAGLGWFVEQKQKNRQF